MKTKRIVTVALSAVLVMGLFTGCGSNTNSNATLVTINEDEKITLGYGNFVAKYNQAIYDVNYGSYYGDDMWTQDLYGNGNTFEEDLKNDIMDDMEEMYVLNQHASDYDVALSDDDNTAIADAVAQFKEDNSEESLEQLGFTEEYLTRFLGEETIATRVKDAIEAAAPVDLTDEDTDEDTQRSDYYDSMIEEWEGELDWVVNEKQLDKISFLTERFEAPAEEEDTDTTEDTAE